MSHEHTISPAVTCAKAFVGLFFATVDPSWDTYSKAAMGLCIPALTIVSLCYDLRRKRRIDSSEIAEIERQKQIRKQREEFFRNKRLRKKKALTSSEDSVSI